MAATDAVITLAKFLKWEAPDGNVLLCDGGVLDYDSERYEAHDSVFGSIISLEPINSAFGDTAESGELLLAPNPEATLTDWWRDDLYDTRIRIWQGEVDSDGVTVSTAKQEADWLVDTVERVQGQGQDLLRIELIARHEKFFQIHEGNVCSERSHTSVWTGELGFRNCTDLVGFVAWGAAAPPRSSSGSGGGTYSGFGSFSPY